MKCSVILPAYNEEHSIAEAVRRTDAVLDTLGGNHEIIVVDDASTDRTPVLLGELVSRHPRLRVIRNPENKGCHPSTRVGFDAATGDVVTFVPSDLQCLPEDVPVFLEAISSFDVVYGYRKGRKDPLFRKAVSGLYNLGIRLLFGVRVHDVDSTSMLRKSVWTALEKEIRADSAFLATELLILARRRGFTIGEVIVRHEPRRGGKAKGLNLKDFLGVPRNLLALLKRS